MKGKVQWRKYDAADKSQRPLFACQVDKGPDGVAVYPQVIQERLRAAMEKVKDGEGAQEERYEMAEDWVMKKRPFIQESLRTAMQNVEDGEAQVVLYEMADDWVMKIRLFIVEEYHAYWREKLAKRVVDDNGDVVGAQWNASCSGEPPDSWDDNATYRPVYQELA